MKPRSTEALNVMSAIEREILTPLVVPVPAFVNSTESPFAGNALFNHDEVLPQFVLLPDQVKTAAAASPDKLLHTSIALAAHRQVEEILKVIFMVITAAYVKAGGRFFEHTTPEGMYLCRADCSDWADRRKGFEVREVEN